MYRKIIAIAAAAVVAVAISSYSADAPQRRKYAVPGHGAVSFNVPSGWSDSVRGSDTTLPPTITLRDPAGHWKVLVTPLWSVRDEAEFNSTASIEKQIRAAAERIKPTAIQPDLPIRELKTADGAGFFFWASDRAPKPGEYEHMAQGAVPVGSLLLQFTILAHEAPPMGISAPLAIITSAQHEN